MEGLPEQRLAERSPAEGTCQRVDRVCPGQRVEHAQRCRCREVGGRFQGAGEYYIQSYAGKNYIIFKGWPAGRSLILGTRYLADNPRIVSMGIGRLGIRNVATAGARLTFILLGAFRILQYLLDDKFTLTRLVGTLATDVVKIAASGLVSYAASGALVAVSSGVVGPLAVAVIIGVGIGYGLELVDQELKLTDRLIAEMDRAITSIGRMPDVLACRANRAVEQSLLDAVDSASEAILEALLRWGEREMQRFMQPQLFPGWSRF